MKTFSAKAIQVADVNEKTDESCSFVVLLPKYYSDQSILSETFSISEIKTGHFKRALNTKNYGFYNGDDINRNTVMYYYTKDGETPYYFRTKEQFDVFLEEYFPHLQPHLSSVSITPLLCSDIIIDVEELMEYDGISPIKNKLIEKWCMANPCLSRMYDHQFCKSDKGVYINLDCHEVQPEQRAHYYIGRATTFVLNKETGEYFFKDIKTAVEALQNIYPKGEPLYVGKIWAGFRQRQNTGDAFYPIDHLNTLTELKWGQIVTIVGVIVETMSSFPRYPLSDDLLAFMKTLKSNYLFSHLYNRWIKSHQLIMSA